MTHITARVRLVLALLLSLALAVPAFAAGKGKSGDDVYVRGYTRKDGTYVQPYYRSAPDGNFNNNWCTKGNVNPYTGQEGTKLYPSHGSGAGGYSSSGDGYVYPGLTTEERRVRRRKRIRNTLLWTVVGIGGLYLLEKAADKEARSYYE